MRLLYFSVFSIILILLIVSSVSAGWLDWIKKITGQAVGQVTVNISVGAGNAPQIILVFNNTDMTDVSGGLTAGPANTNISFNFSVLDADGNANIQDNTVQINFTRTGENVRINSSTLPCTQIASDGNYANYSCNMTMYWWDGAGAWNISIEIKDANGNNATNTSTTFQVGPTTGFQVGPATLGWNSLSPGATNETSNNDPLELNNTGNVVIAVGGISINATPLTGENIKTDVILAERFSVRTNTSGDIGPDMECNGTMMSDAHAYVVIGIANLSVGDYRTNDAVTGQEELFFCLTNISSILSSQPYSTWGNGTWTIQAV